MRLALLTAFLAIVSAQVCDPSQQRTLFYADEKCTQVNETMTKQYQYLPKEYYFMQSGKCSVKYPGKEWVIMTCDEKGFHEEMFQDANCTKPITYVKAGRVDFPWDACVSVPEVSKQTLRVTTTQTNFKKVGNRTLANITSPAAERFDKFFY